MSALDFGDLKHLAVIMDGNGRWARARNRTRTKGHRAGVDSVRDCVTECARGHLGYLTLFALSTENYRARPPLEVRTLMALLKRFMVNERPTLMKNDVKLRTIGRLRELPPRVVAEIRKTEAITAKNLGMTLTLALNYGGRAEICDAARELASQVQRGTLRPDEINEERFAQALYDPKLPDVDLLVRTAGELRVSNFLLWQISYSEIHVTSTCWPDFRKPEIEAAIAAFRRRARRFGGLLEGEDG